MLCVGRVAAVGALAIGGCIPLIAEPKAPASLESGQGRSGLAPARVGLGAIEGGASGALREVWVEGQGMRAVRVWALRDGAPRAVFVFLHGAVIRNPRGGRPIGGERQTQSLLDCLALPALRRLAPIMVLPVSKDGRWWREDETRYVLGLVRAVTERWPASRERRVVLGYSNGGIGAWFFARLYSESFDAAVPMASDATIVGASPLPIYVIHGADDEVFPVAPVRTAVERLAHQGAKIRFDERPEGSHLDACGYVPELTAAGHWLEAALPSLR